jgi:general secretion pathway protein L
MQGAMTPQNILNADLATIGRWLHTGFVWWIDELSSLVPERYRRNARRRARWTARVDRDGVIQLWRDGRPTQATPPSPSAGWRADVVLPAEAVLVRDLDLPRLSNADLGRMLQANMDRFTPFPAERIYFDAPAFADPDDEARARVRLAVIPRERALEALARARALGLEVERLGTEDAGGAPAFDFMAAIRADQGGSSGRRRLALWWSACAGLMALNVLAASLMDLRDVRRLAATVEAEQPRVAAATRIHKAAAAEQGVRLALLARRSQNEPLRIVDALTKALPDRQWTHRLEWNGRTVRIVGFKAQGFDVPGALRHTPALTNPRSLLADMPVKTAAGVEPFDVIADSATRAPK